MRALLLQAFYSVRSERLLMEQLDYNLLFRWFVGLGIDDPVWHPTAFTTNRDRLLEGEVAANFLAAVLGQARLQQLLSRAHFSVDGTLIEAWASMKSFRSKDGADEPPTPPAATAAATFTASGGATTPMPRPPMTGGAGSDRRRYRDPAQVPRPYGRRHLRPAGGEWTEDSSAGLSHRAWGFVLLRPLRR